MPKVSVVMSAYNESKSDIEKSIESILNQSFSDFEFIIILDNPSNYDLKKILKEYETKDKRIKVFVNEENMGLARSLNKGIELSSGELICRMDADDISFNNRIELQVKKFENNPKLDVLSGSIIKIDENDNEIGKCIYQVDSKRINKTLLKADIIVHPSVMFKRERIMAIGNYRNFPTAQDFDLWLRCVTSNYNIDVMSDTILYYRVRSTSITSTKALQQWLTHEYIIGLYRERVKKGVDNYSDNNYNNFLSKRNLNSKQKEKFNKGLKYIPEIKSDLKEKRIINSVIKSIKLFLSHKEMPKYLAYIMRLSKLQNKR